MAKPVTDLVFRRTSINLNDAARLGEGEDLNDALIDFFVKLGQALIPNPKHGGKENPPPVAFLGTLFFKQLQTGKASSGEEGWKHVQNWAKRKAGGMFSEHYGAFAVPINEDLKDDKGKDAGNHWWLALLLNPPGGATVTPTAVMCLDSMQRREKELSPPAQVCLKGSLNRYPLEVKKIEQAGYLLIITFDARGDGCRGALQNPRASKLHVDGLMLRDPELGLKINMGGAEGVAGRYEGTLTFGLDGRCRSSVFELEFGEHGYPKIKMEFDPFALTKVQKFVSRYLGGYLAKEWEQNGPKKSVRFEKQSARALVADVFQQENLNDCGVFVLENTLRSLSMSSGFLKKMAEAKPEELINFPWPTQGEITARKASLRAIIARLYSAAAASGKADVEELIKADPELRQEVLASLTNDRGEAEGLDKWAGDLQKELAARQVEKDKEAAINKKKQETVDARRAEEAAKRADEEALLEKERLNGKNPPKRFSPSPSSSRSRSPSRRKKDKKRNGKDKERSREKEKTKSKKRRKDDSRSSSESSRSRSQRRRK